MITPLTWEAHVVPDPVTGNERLVLVSRRGTTTIVLKGFDEDNGSGVIESVAEGVRVDVESLPLFAPGMLQAIAEAIKPGPAAEVVSLLKEQLQYERNRVDKLLFPLVVLDSPA